MRNGGLKDILNMMRFVKTKITIAENESFGEWEYSGPRNSGYGKRNSERMNLQ